MPLNQLPYTFAPTLVGFLPQWCVCLQELVCGTDLSAPAAAAHLAKRGGVGLKELSGMHVTMQELQSLNALAAQVLPAPCLSSPSSPKPPGLSATLERTWLSVVAHTLLPLLACAPAADCHGRGDPPGGVFGPEPPPQQGAAAWPELWDTTGHTQCVGRRAAGPLGRWMPQGPGRSALQGYLS